MGLAKKKRSTDNFHHLFDSVRGGRLKLLQTNNTNGNFGPINSFDSNGFDTVGTGGQGDELN